MDDRLSPFSRTQPSRSSFRSAIGHGRKSIVVATDPQPQRQITPRQSKQSTSPKVAKRFAAPHTVLDNLKQWELVEGDRGLQVVEKRGLAHPPAKTVERSAGPGTLATIPLLSKNTLPANLKIDPSLEEKLKAFKNSKIVQPIPMSKHDHDRDRDNDNDGKLPVSLDLILQQKKGSTAESTDMLERLELQVRAIEMDTLAARTRQLEMSSDFEPEIQLRYREHEDLLRNVTDDEAEG